ncbi:helix-turn-helix domain-containing protein [Streptomyces hygroscopicus]|uniref:helix-turn-helix domain-containing protein n=1 Tax=Streptomyces hygroscopicus TaxID=1912 RepID=UPI00082D8F19|nr:helix-turn-helix domain-containing protein [Streptomyces hygroscopicus]GLV78800.1 AraC family transcriptional regulator [Streptomyces hygroscopicus subsp. hygroscopicus]
MSDYRERKALIGGGAVVWTRTAGAGPQRVLPDGCTDLIWSGTGPDGELIVAGPDTRAHLASGPPGTHAVGLRFAPGAGPAVLGVPAHELRDLRVPLAALWPDAEVRRLAERIAERTAGRAAERIAGRTDGGITGRAAERIAGRESAPGRVLEEAALDRLRTAEPPDPVLATIVAGASRGTGVAGIAAAVGLGERQLHRRSLAAFGYGAKTLGRVLRLNRALDLARTGVRFAEVAATAGYADQAHLAREVRTLTGVPLSRLLRAPGG